MLCHSTDEAPFRELVAARGSWQAGPGWLGAAEAPLEVSAVEADARLARWSRKTGALALRITRTDPTRWWIAVHFGGQRLFTMVQNQAADLDDPNEALLADPELGQDPLLELSREPGLTQDEVRTRVARERGQQLAGALQAAGIDIPTQALQEALLATEGDLAIIALVDLIGARDLYDLVRTVTEPAGGGPLHPVPGSLQSAVSKAVLTGCIVPASVATLLFVAFSRYAVHATGSPMAALLLGSIAAWLGSWGTRALLGARGRNQGGNLAQRMTLDWATDAPTGLTAPQRPTPAAHNTWGGLFFLLRDIAFFAGIDRPTGPMALYIDAWAMGPSVLVQRINAVALGQAPPDPLYDLAQGLVELRGELVDHHLANQEVHPEQIADKVRNLLRPVAL